MKKSFSRQEHSCHTYDPKAAFIFSIRDGESRKSNTGSRLMKIESAILLAMLAAVVLSICGFSNGCENVRDSVLRLHVIANSDSAIDQSIKLQVRDAVLAAGAEVFDGSVTADEAEMKIEPQKEKLIAAAREVLEKNGADTAVDITVGREYFNTRCYGEITMPAGEYSAVKVIIGCGEGKNWWCVMFPPLCLGAACEEVAADAYFNAEETEIISSSPKYEPRFKIVEIIEKLKQKF